MFVYRRHIFYEYLQLHFKLITIFVTGKNVCVVDYVTMIHVSQGEFINVLPTCFQHFLENLENNFFSDIYIS